MVGKKVTDFLDLNAVIEASAGNWEQGGGVQSNGKMILVADGSTFTRGMIRAGLEMSGFDVVEAINADEAMHRLDQQPIDLVVLAHDLPPNGYDVFLDELRRNPDRQSIPVLGLAENDEKARLAALRGSGCKEWASKSNHALVAELVSRIVLPQASLEEQELVCAGEER